jgi:hypothetical protein
MFPTPASALTAGDDLECVVSREERVPGCAADGFEEDGAADPGHAFCCRGKVPDREFVLLFGVKLVLPVAVEGVESLAAQALADAGNDVDVVLELGLASRPGHQAAVTAGHVAGVEVQAGELHAGVGDGVLESVTSASLGTELSKGHQNSTASKPAALAAAGRSSRGSSVRRMEQFTVYVIVGPSGEGFDLSSPASRLFYRFRFVEFRFCFMKSVGKGWGGVKGGYGGIEVRR